MHMAVPMLPYAVDHYSSLPDLGVAKDTYEATRVSEILFTEIEKSFVAHHVGNILGVALLQNRFLLEAHEMLVNVESVAVPWDATSGAEELVDVDPSSWRFTDDGLAPYEFVHATSELSLDDHHMQSFL